jgi:glutamyl-tRNA synthetase/glutamyl-Q tRNA(Asp) synthetase
MTDKPIITRFAPSPTGYLHLGHVVNALFVWGLAKLKMGKVILRMEDHDQTRCKLEFEEAILEDLEILGLQPELGVLSTFKTHPCDFRQSDCQHHYDRALSDLIEKNLVYACDCSRMAVRNRTGQPDSDDLQYDGFCQSRNLPLTFGHTLRVKLSEELVSFHDWICGPQIQEPAKQCGDLAIKDKNGNWTYQFAVVVDDIRHGVDWVVRGRDLLFSTGRQILIRKLLGEASMPQFAHHNLLTDPSGRKLSKKDFDSDIHVRLKAGIAPELILGEALYKLGFQTQPHPIDTHKALELVGRYYSSLGI